MLGTLYAQRDADNSDKELLTREIKKRLNGNGLLIKEEESNFAKRRRESSTRLLSEEEQHKVILFDPAEVCYYGGREKEKTDEGAISKRCKPCMLDSFMSWYLDS